MRASITGACLAAALVALSACQAAAPQFTAEDETALRGMFDATVTNIKAGDWAQWSEQFAENAMLQPPNAKPVNGRAAILAWGQEFPPVEDLSFSDVQVSGEGNTAWGSSAYVLKIKDAAAADSGKQLVVFRRLTGPTWEVAAVSFGSNLPVPLAPAPASGPPKR